MTNQPTEAGSWAMLFAAFSIALVASLSALFIGEVLGQVPCSLCWFQRSFMFPLAIVLAIAAFRSDPDVWKYALPLAGGGLLIAAYHTLLYSGVLPQSIEPCGVGPSCTSADMTILGAIPLPVVSTITFGAIAVCLLYARQRSYS